MGNPRIDKLTELNASFDSSWRRRGWAYRDGIVHIVLRLDRKSIGC